MTQLINTVQDKTAENLVVGDRLLISNQPQALKLKVITLFQPKRYTFLLGDGQWIKPLATDVFKVMLVLVVLVNGGGAIAATKKTTVIKRHQPQVVVLPKIEAWCQGKGCVIQPNRSPDK